MKAETGWQQIEVAGQAPFWVWIELGDPFEGDAPDEWTIIWPIVYQGRLGRVITWMTTEALDDPALLAWLYRNANEEAQEMGWDLRTGPTDKPDLPFSLWEARTVISSGWIDFPLGSFRKARLPDGTDIDL